MNATGTQTRLSLKNILYASDFSQTAETALPFVKGLSRQYTATVHALHVRTPFYPIVGPEGLPQIMEAEKEQSKLDAQQLNEKLLDVPHRVTVVHGDVWPSVADIVQQQDIDMIVMRARGRSGIAKVALGSVAEEVFRQAACLVLTVGPNVGNNAQRELGMKEILFATDFSGASMRALPYAVSLAQDHQARLTILHVIDKAEAGELVHAEDYVESMLRQLRELVPTDARSECKTNARLETGSAGEKILEVALAEDADLIILGIRGATGYIGAITHLFRSTAHQVLSQAACPVLTIRG